MAFAICMSVRVLIGPDRPPPRPRMFVKPESSPAAPGGDKQAAGLVTQLGAKLDRVRVHLVRWYKLARVTIPRLSPYRPSRIARKTT